MNSASPRAITAIIALGFASSDYCIILHSAAPRAINGVIAFIYAVRLAYIIPCSVRDARIKPSATVRDFVRPEKSVSVLDVMIFNG